MTKSSRKKGSPRLLDEIERLRMQVAAAETVYAEAREHAARAKRQRKLAKLLAKRARKEAKRAKTKLEEAREALAQAKAVAGRASARRRPALRKTRKPAPAPRRMKPVTLPKSRRPSARRLAGPKRTITDAIAPTPPPAVAPALLIPPILTPDSLQTETDAN